jgi:hypothetical protein
VEIDLREEWDIVCCQDLVACWAVGHCVLSGSGALLGSKHINMC